MTAMTDGIAWLAEPRSIAWGGYGIVMARDLESESLARRVAATGFRGRTGARFIGELTGRQTEDVLAGVFGGDHQEIALRHGELGEWAYVIKYGSWQDQFGGTPRVDRGELHVFHLEFEEENGKPVPPVFSYCHDGSLMCAFNLHLDGSWGYDGVQGEPGLASAVQDRLSAAGLPDHDLDHRTVHRASLKVLQEHFGLSLPRQRIVEGTLPTLLLTAP